MRAEQVVDQGGLSGREDLAACVAEVRALAVRSLARMFLPQREQFCFCLRRATDGTERLEGASARYTAIVLLALANEDRGIAEEVLHGRPVHDVCGRLVERVSGAADLGEVALTLWAARVLDHPGAGRVLAQLREMEPDTGSYPTVEVAWSLTAQVVAGSAVCDKGLAERLAGRLVSTCRAASGLFGHWPEGAAASRWRGHVCCYADLVYPIQALSYYHRWSGDAAALEVSRRCGLKMCELQGQAGQWWWHYDVRTGRVVERYPVYAVHQDAMGPMALRALEEAGGGSHREAVARSMDWLINTPEPAGSLVDRSTGVIWRKVARHEPGKLVRSIQAGLSRACPVLRVPFVDTLFPPTAVDYESRPYHMGWILHAWRAGWGS